MHEIQTTIREGKVYADLTDVAALIQEVAEQAGSFTCYQLATILRRLDRDTLDAHIARMENPADAEEIRRLESQFAKEQPEPKEAPDA